MPFASCLLILCLAVTEPPAPLTGEEVSTLALQQHPDVLLAQLQLSEAQSLRVGAAMWLPDNPFVSIAAGHRHDTSQSRPASTGPEWTLQVGQSFEVANQRGLRLKEASFSRDAAGAALSETRLVAVGQALSAFVHAQEADAIIRSAQRRAKLAEHVWQMVLDKEKAGATAGLERNLAGMELGAARAMSADAGVRAAATRASLQYMLGLVSLDGRPLAHLFSGHADSNAGPAFVAEASQVEATGTLFTTDTPEPAAQTSSTRLEAFGPPLEPHEVDEALSRRPWHQVLRAKTTGIQTSFVRATREIAPNVTLGFEAQHQQPGQHYYGGQLGLTLPVARRQQGVLAQMQVQHQQALLRERLFAQQVTRDLMRTKRAVQCTEQAFLAIEHQQLPAARSHVDMSVAAWRAGKLDFGHVVQSLRYLAEARQRHIEAKASFEVARIALAQVDGTLVTHDAAQKAKGS